MNQLGNVRTAKAVHSRAATRLRRWQRVFRSALALGLFSIASSASAAIPIGEGLNGPFTLDTAPPATDWSTASIAGGGGDVTTVEQLTTAVQAFTAASIATALPVDATAVPPLS